MSYLMIENSVKSVPSIDLLCTLGASGSRGKTEQIGQFGSGFPYSIALFAREGILKDIKLCLGKEVYTFLEERVDAKTGNGDDFIMNKLIMKKQNGGKYPLNISSGFGEIDWTDITMAVREFVSNAFDGANESFNNYDGIVIKEVNDNQCRAKDDTIRMFIPMTLTVKNYFNALHEKFLMLNSGYNPSEKTLHNNTSNETRFYRKGVYVGKVDFSGAFHYNLPDLDLKESRNLNIYSAYQAAGRTILCSDENVIEKYLEAMISDNKHNFENHIDGYYLNIKGCNYDTRKEAQSNIDNWKKAYKSVFKDTLVSDKYNVIERIRRNGFQGKLISTKLFEIIEDKGIETADDLMSADDLLDRIISEPTSHVSHSLSKLWAKLASHDLTKNKRMPNCKCFTQPMSGESQSLGYYKDNTVFIHTDISNGSSFMLDQTMLEEVAHYITQATDNSRDFQDYAFRVAATFMTQETNENVDIKEYLRTANVTLKGSIALITGWKKEIATIIDTDDCEQILTISWSELYDSVKAGKTDF